ncbi:MAG: hypothetical protein QOE90_2976 [Thermoplasmata archaeon]|jgi:methyltransferase (TIGR00027 family)|nr:hypothetical protein [Thermoplasmata archaeon]
MTEPLVRHVSDTARWIAAYRAQESARPDALFHDPFAARFADERGRAIAKRMSGPARASITVRTVLLDEMVLAAVARGADRVLNLAAGFDARPYRLPLPPTLRWIEADLPELLDEKEAALAGERPRCDLARERVDLADPAARDAFLDRALAGARDALVVTEGLLVYLREEDVRGLSAALRARTGVGSWAFDLLSPQIARYTSRSAALENAPLRFAPDDGVAWFEREGWRVAEVRDAMREAVRTRRAPLYVRLFARWLHDDPRKLATAYWYGVVRLSPQGADQQE